MVLLADKGLGERMAEKKWKRFEKLIHQIHTELAPQGAIVKLDDKIVGRESKVERQLDVTIRVSVVQYNILIVVECKDEARPIDVGAMGGFASLLRDVRANKGVMISTSGYTPAAIEMARAQGIDSRTYLDTESVDWKSVVTIPVLLRRAKIKNWSVRFLAVPGFPWGAPTNIQFPFIETFAEDGTPLGPIITMLGRIWNHDKSLHVPGEHTVLLAEHVLLNVGNARRHSKLEAVVNVEQYRYFGPLPVKMAGFRDEQSGSLSTKEMTTDFLEPARIERGEMPGWQQIPTDSEIAITIMMEMGYVDALPEKPEDIKSQPPSAIG
jgi:hypothetical protein